MTRRRGSSSGKGSSSRGSSGAGEQQFREDEFWKKVAGLPKQASSRLIYEALLLYCILTDRSTPMWVRSLIAVALVYLINPFDAIPDAIPVLGYVDDAAVIGVVLNRISAYATPAIRERASRLVPGNK